jgi:hypothetical protein
VPVAETGTARAQTEKTVNTVKAYRRKPRLALSGMGILAMGQFSFFWNRFMVWVLLFV